jgi:ABC-2 type transport system ATP-binding protein
VRDAVISVKNLQKDYYQYKVFARGKLLTKALQGLDFDIKKGDFVGLIGVNGAGKSTLMRILTTNMIKSGGTVRIAGYDLDKDEEEIKKHISWMFGQDYYGIGWASLEKNMHLAASFLGLDKKEAQQRIGYLLKRFNLEDKRRTDVWRLSTGMVAKYSLAVALLKRPEILFLDEPLLGLDTYAKDEIRAILQELNNKGTTILYTDHQLQEVEKICKRLLIINKGKILFQGTTKKLKQVYRDTHVLRVVCSGTGINKALLKLKKKRICTDYKIKESEGDTHTVRIYTPVDSKKKLLQVVKELKKKKIIVDEISAGLLGLEDVYRKFIKVDKETDAAKQLADFDKAGERPLKEFEKLLQHKNASLRAHACAVFWKKNKKKVRPILLQMLQGNKKMQKEALQVVGEIRDKSFMDNVLEILESKTKVRNHAVIALAKMGNETVVPTLVKLLLDHERVGFVLEHVQDFDNDVLVYMQEKIQRLSRYDKAYLQHHCEKTKHPRKLLEALGLLHRDYRQWKKAKFRKGVN